MATDQATPKPSLRRRLGRGLESLISTPVQIELPPSDPQAPPTAASQPPPPPPQPAAAHNQPVLDQRDRDRAAEGLHLLPLEHIQRNPRQPRQDFDEQSLAALANSIRASGVMQPIVVRPIASGDGAPQVNAAHTARYQIVAGERRWRAAQAVGLQTIPALIRELDDRSAAELSLVENLQREDLNAIERALAFRQLITDFGLTHAQVAERVGLERSSVTNHLRLLELDGGTQDAVRRGALTLGHAKALLAITNISQRAELAAQALRQSWSVREIERRAQQQSSEASNGAAGKRSPLGGAAPPHLADLERRLSEHLGTKVRLHTARGKAGKTSGKLAIEFYSLDQFEGILKRLNFKSE